MVYYRKYRPQTIEELDLDSVRTKLTAILKNQEIPHAFLFTGPKGLGKTSSARILAKAINCEKNQEAGIKKQGKRQKEQTPDSKFMIHDSNIEPCNKCDACVSITSGSAVDVLELDAASNRGIDEIRELRDKIKFSPAVLSKKIYIIDEVHMLTTDAFNALLKTLEEPPDHAIFILCTTEVWKVPPTIASRTFHVSFEKPTQEELVRSLRRIVKGEKLDIENGVLEEIYKLSEGSFRDGSKILEDLSIVSSGKKIKKELLEETYKSDSIEKDSREILIFLAQKKAKEALIIIEKLFQKGTDMALVNEKIVEELRLQLLATAGIQKNKDTLNFDVRDLEILIDFFSESYKHLKYTVIPSLPLELAIMRWCYTDETLEKNENEEKKIDVEKKEEVVAQKKDDISDDKKFGELFNPTSVGQNFFLSLLDSVKKDNHSIAGILRGCSLVSLDKEKVVLEAKYKFHRDKLNEDKIMKIIEKRAGEILRKDIRIIIELKK
ncbi:MAG: DNA polymerase III, subunit gamma and tau [Candidatus Levybacteria bacterium CG_4_10_14_0_2_um_filter_36_16]|nr:MAG: DNA polymerase III, subunit gamma and tau [Candidatus Levybacteria bacterium CG2_30_37_29]PIZ97936.1 MAG: DNA polymerase III, subunit gamma and tau [Candidatus Levybacteria bacterium CG_4_10_14_0_2_um_filter_36_16]PJA90857.1 MAG: DNA polymerase III, subunit gamma and tau [Candidatus Levybacteria bacterium CG_4_9_14_3_um_filter_36_7]